MLILHRMTQLGVMTQKPVNVDLVSHPYPFLEIEQAYKSDVSMVLLRNTRRGIQGDEAYTPAAKLLSISKRNALKRLGVQGDEAYTPAVEMVSLIKKDIVVTNFSDDKTGYIGSAKMLSIVKKRG